MNSFVDFQKRGIELPKGCKDLNDVIKMMRAKAKQPSEPAKGLEDIDRYVVRMLSSASRSSLWIDGCRAATVSLFCGKRGLQTFILVDAEREQSVRGVFDDSGIAPIQDESVPDAKCPTRMLTYRLPSTVASAAQYIRALLVKGLGLPENVELQFRYREKNAGFSG